MEVLVKGLLACTLGHLFQIFTICIVILAVVQGKSEDHLATIDFNEVPAVAAETAHIFSNGAARVGASIRQRRHIDTSKADRPDFFFNFISPESLGETEYLFPQPHYHDRARRAACWGGMGTGGGGGVPSGGGGVNGGATVDGGTVGGGADIDVVERRRQAARKRQAAQKKKSRSKKNSTSKSKKHFLDDHDDAVEQYQRRRKRQANKEKDITQYARTFADNIHGGWKKYKNIANGMAQQMKQNVRRRKRRQAEVDDLNIGSSNTSTDISEHFRQVGEKIRSAWENFAQSMSALANKMKNAINGGNQGNQGAEEV